MKNRIGIDISLTSTAIYIKTKERTEYLIYKNHNKLSKWYKELDFIKYTSYATLKSKDNSTQEVYKINSYNDITDIILQDLLKYTTPLETRVVLEGYSYSSSNTSSLIDIVAYTSLLRVKLIQAGYELIIVSPSELKMKTAMITYSPDIKIIHSGKPNQRVEKTYKNKQGVTGGRFTKNDMYMAIIDNERTSILKNKLISNHITLSNLKNIPKPIDDIIDAYFLVETDSMSVLNDEPK